MINKRGVKDFDSGNFETALKKFKAAFEFSDHSNPDKQLFKDNENHAKASILNSEGNVFYTDSKYDEAIAKYREAIKTVPLDRKSHIETYMNNLAGSLNRIGLKLYEEKKYKEALAKQEEAVRVSSDNNTSLQTFKDNVKQDMAALLNEEGDVLYNAEKYEEALSKYKEALDIIPAIRTASVNIYKDNIAHSLNKIGIKHYDAKEFENAQKKFEEALEAASSNNTGRSTYIGNINHSKAVISNKVGNDFFSKEDYENAILKYREALKFAPSDKTSDIRTFTNNIAFSLSKLGWISYNKKEYDQAAKKFEEARDTIKNEDSSLKKFKKYLNDAKAKQFNKEGDKLYADMNYDAALIKYQEALKFVPSDETKDIELYKNNVAYSSNKIGWNFYKQNKYKEAIEKFEKARDTINDNVEREKFKKNVMDAKARLLNEEGNVLYSKNEFDSAIFKYKEALKTVPEGEETDIKAYNENIAYSINKIGHKFYEAKNYQMAKRKFEEARDYYPKHSKIELLKINVIIAQAQILNTEGDNLYSKEKYYAAIQKYEEALKVVPSSRPGDIKIFTNNIASSLNKIGLKYFENSEYDSARKKFQEAFDRATSDYSGLKTFQENRNYAKAATLNLEGNDFYNAKKYEEAVDKYKAAVEIIPESKADAKKTFRNNLAGAYNQVGVIFYNRKSYSMAKTMFQQAYKISTADSKNLSLYKKNIENTSTFL
jgi:tetratricopeptide (TPR) repeat protein